MGLTDFLALILGICQFPREMRRFLAFLQGASPEQREAISKALDAEEEKLKTEGRPTWT